MANRKPLVLNSGVISELVSTDSLDVTSNLPIIAPVFNWNFRRGKVLDNRLTITRNSAVASHINELGVLTADVANVPRFEHLLGVSKGLLIEPVATNLCTRSAELDSTAWVKTNITVSAGSTYFLDGTTTADTLVETITASVQHSLNTAGSYTITAGASAISWWIIKSAGRTKGTIKHVISSFTTQIAADYDLTTKTITSAYQSIGSGSTSMVSGIKELGKEWFLVYVGGILDASSTAVRQQVILSNGSTVTYTGDGTSGIYIGHAQCELGLVPTSIIQTTSTAVTRALDLYTVPVANFNFYRQDEYTIVCGFYGQASGTCTIWELSDTTANERIYFESISGALTLKIVDGGVEQCSLYLGNVVTGTFYTVSAAWKLNDIAASINGANVVTDTSAILPTLTTMGIGCNYAGANQMNEALAFISGYAARLTNAELQSLSV